MSVTRVVSATGAGGEGKSPTVWVTQTCGKGGSTVVDVLIGEHRACLTPLEANALANRLECAARHYLEATDDYSSALHSDV